jgi:hypothetical protein
MWRRIVEYFPSIWAICEKMNMHWNSARKNIGRYKLEVHVQGTADRQSWYAIARKANFHTPEEMFYTLRISRQMSYVQIAKFLDIKDVERLRNAYRAFFDPTYKKWKQREKDRGSKWQDDL